MGLLFQGDQRQDFVTVIEEVTQRVENLSLGDAQRLGDVENRFAPLMQGDNVADGHPQAVNHWLTPANAFEANDVGVFGPYSIGHSDFSAIEGLPSFASVASGRQPG
jgi:hypothetical protein